MPSSLNRTATISAPTTRPTDFRYDDALARPGVQRLRRAVQRIAGFDLCPSPQVVELFSQDMWTGDPIAEAYVDEVHATREGRRTGRADLEQAIAYGIDSVPDAPASMRTLLEQFETVPDWVDRDLVEQGAAIWRRWGTDLFGVAGAGTLEMYTEGAVAIPLSLAGGYAGDNALRRFLETTRFWMDVSEPGALFERGSAGRTTAMHVRVMHVSVRHRVADHPEWDSERWGLPISQAYMLLTLMGGSVAPALAMWQVGYQTTPTEIRALLHFQRYLGHLLGVHPRWYPANIREGIQIVFMAAIARSHSAGPHGAELIESFPKAFDPSGKSMSPAARARAEYDYRLICAYVALLMAPSTRRRHDLPPVLRWLPLILLRLPYITVREALRRIVPGGDAIAERRARHRAETWYATQMNGRQAAFDASSQLRR